MTRLPSYTEDEGKCITELKEDVCTVQQRNKPFTSVEIIFDNESH